MLQKASFINWLQLKTCRKLTSSIGSSSKRAENQLHQSAPAQNVLKTSFINRLQLKTCRKPASSIGWIIWIRERHVVTVPFVPGVAGGRCRCVWEAAGKESVHLGLNIARSSTWMGILTETPGVQVPLNICKRIQLGYVWRQIMAAQIL